MIVFLNKEFVPEEQATVSVFDRSFQYGDGLFETIRIVRGQPFHWKAHLERLAAGATFLGIHVPFTSVELFEALTELVRLNHAPESVLRLTLSRGVGPRGYSPKGADHPVVVMSLHPVGMLTETPTQWKLFTASLRLPVADPLARWKTNNKLVQILARAEAEQQGAQEALLLNTCGDVCETSSGNVFWFTDTTLHTPPNNAGSLPGVTRAVIRQLGAELGLTVAETQATPEALHNSKGALISLSTLGVVEVSSLDGRALPQNPHTRSLHRAYQRLLETV